jgi:cyanuric acid amidohydrolase
MTAIDVYVLEPDAPDDTSEFEQLLETGEIAPSNVVAVLGKTEGNGCVNDFSRGLATMAYERVLASHLGVDPSAVEHHVSLIMSGGTEGVMTPHVTVFVRRESGDESTEDKRLSAARAATRPFEPEEVGRFPQVQATAAAVERAMETADIADGSDVHYVQVKCPLLTADRITTARERDESVVTSDTYESMAYSRGASALGVALGTGELSEETVRDTHICGDASVYSTVASTSAGSELRRNEILLLGNAASAGSDFVISHAVMEDALDSGAIERAATRAGVKLPAENPDVTNVFAKAQATSDGTIRGRRHVIHDDSDINATRHARAVVSSVVGSTIGDPLSYVSGGAEHQGPDGGGPVAVIADATR